MKTLVGVAGCVCALVTAAVSSHAALVVLDNTQGLTSTDGGTGQDLAGSKTKALVFNTGTTTDNHINAATLMLTRQSAGSANVVMSLYAVDGSNFPTGSPLASENFTRALTTSAAYETFSFVGQISAYAMAGSTKYALTVNCPDATPISWRYPNPTGTPTASDGYSYVGFMYNNGVGWSGSSAFNAVQIEASSVPEPASYCLSAAVALLGLAVGRRWHKSA